MTELWIASANPGKLHELRVMLSEAGLGLVPRLMTELAPVPDVVEDGATLEANAERKATTVAQAAHGLALGDDSGLFVAALGGSPGVHSARWAGPGATDADRIAKLLRELEGVPDGARTASFVCSLCLAEPSGDVVLRVEGRCHGMILRAPRGTRGFGYDPVFLHSESGKTFAELDAAEKNSVSHRGVALARLVAGMRRLLASISGGSSTS